MNAPVCDKPFVGIRVSTIEPTSDGDQEFLVLTEQFPKIPPAQLRLIVIELVSNGLVKDEGVGRFGAAAMEKFSPLPTGQWMLDWISRND